MADFVELGATGLDHITNTKGWDKTYDFVTRANKKKGQQQQQQQQQQQDPHGRQGYGGKENRRNNSQLAKRNSTGAPRRRRELPSPERERPRSHHYPDHGNDAAYDYDEELERQSVASDRVLRAYENEADDPRRAPPPQQLATYQHPQGPYQFSADGYYDGQDRTRMSYAARPRSQPPRAREYYSDDESDYDDRSGRRYTNRSARGRGYDDRNGPFDREVVEREVYRGPPRASGPLNGYTPYAAPVAVGGAVAPYRRSTADLRTREKSRARSKSRGRRSYSSSRSRSRSRGKSQWREKVDETFDTSWQGWGATVAGALVGGAAGREIGDRRHRKRDMVIGALVGGVGANVAENKWREHKEGKQEEGHGGYRRGEDRDRLRPYEGERYERRGRSTG